MTTLRDVARAAGVSHSTVSKALRGAGDLNPETARRIRETAAELGYRVRERRNGARHTVGVICPELLGSYYARMAAYLADALQARGMDMLLAVSGFDPAREESLLESFTARNLSGIVCVTENDLGHALRHIPASVPTVVAAANYSPEDRDVICIDECTGMRRVAEHLTGLGHTRIAFAGTRYGEKRLEYLNQELFVRNAEIPASRVYLSDSRHGAAGYEAAQALMKEAPTAIVAEYDDVALGVMRRLSEMGVRVPEDVSVTGFDNADFCASLPVALTSVDSHVEELCAAAADTLLRKMENPGSRVMQSISVKPTLVVRDSTAAPAMKAGTSFETI